MSGRIAVSFEGVSKTFGDHAVLENVSCTLEGGRIVAITGRNGSGKSTFLRLAGHLLRPSEGRVVVTAGDAPLTRDDLRRHLGLLAPELALSPELTGLENLDFLAGLRGRTLTDDEKAALCERVGLAPEDARKRVKTCSTGQRQRLALAVLLASNADLWLLDEPGANLDEAGRETVRREARAAAERGALVLIATNDAGEAAWADEVLTLGRDANVTTHNEAILQPKAPSQRELSAKLTEGVSKVGTNFINDFVVEGTNQQPPTTKSRINSRPTSDTPPAASRPSPLWEGGLDKATAFATLHLLRRELMTALRSRSSLAVMALFSITALLALSMALGGTVLAPAPLSAMLWALLFFASSMGLGGTFAADEAAGTLLTLRVYGAGQAVLYGKTAFSLLMLLLLAVVLVPLFFVLLDATCTAPLLLLAALVLGLVGLAAAGTLLSTLTAGSGDRAAGGLLPVLLLPVILPVFLPAVSLTQAALGGRPAGLSLLVGMGLYDLLLLVGSSLLFDALWYED